MTSIEEMKNEFNSKFGNFAKLLRFDVDSIKFDCETHIYCFTFRGGKFEMIKDGEISPAIQKFDEKIFRLNIWSREKLQILQKTRITEYNNPEHESFCNMLEAIKKHCEIVTELKKRDFEKQNFQITSFDDFRFCEIENPMSKELERSLKLTFSFGLEDINFSFVVKGIFLESSCDIAKINCENCEFESLDKYVPLPKLHEFERIFRWTMKTLQVGQCDMIFKEKFSIDQETFERKSKQALFEKFSDVIYNVDCYPNYSGEHRIFFSVLSINGGENPFLVTESEISGPGFEYRNGKILQNIYIDKYIPMDKRELVTEIIKFCAILVGHKNKLSFHIGRQTYDFERKFQYHEEERICVDSNEIYYYCDSVDKFVTYVLGETPRNNMECHFATTWDKVKPVEF